MDFFLIYELESEPLIFIIIISNGYFLTHHQGTPSKCPILDNPGICAKDMGKKYYVFKDKGTTILENTI